MIGRTGNRSEPCMELMIRIFQRKEQLQPDFQIAGM